MYALQTIAYNIAYNIVSNSIVVFLIFIATIYSLYLTVRVKRAIELYGDKKIYNEKQKQMMRTFIAHREHFSKNPTNITRARLAKLDSEIVSFHTEFRGLLTIYDRFNIFLIKRIIKKPVDKINPTTLTHYMAYLSGRLAIAEKEELK